MCDTEQEQKKKAFLTLLLSISEYNLVPTLQYGTCNLFVNNQTAHKSVKKGFIVNMVMGKFTEILIMQTGRHT